MKDTSDTNIMQIQLWLNNWTQALGSSDIDALKRLWITDSHWRDVLGLHWNLQTTSGCVEISETLIRRALVINPRKWSVRTGPLGIQKTQRAGRDVIECILDFETDVGPCEAVLRLVVDAAENGTLKAWSLMTALVEIKGHEEKFKNKRHKSNMVGRSFIGPNWLERREESIRFDDRDPAVLVVGSGQAGLSVAARLSQLGIDTLVIDKNERVGDNWRKRYNALVLHNQSFVNHLPYLPFPDTWPTYIPKDMLAGWFEYYAQAMELNVWCESTFTGGHYDSVKGSWEVSVLQGDKVRCLRPRHLILCTGVSSIPNRSPIDDLDVFQGPIIHSADYKGAHSWVGKSVVVMGTGTSAHDVAQDLCENGAQVTMIQRSPTMVQNVEPTAQLPYVLYDQGLPVSHCDLVSLGTPMEVYKENNRIANRLALSLDRDTIEGLEIAQFTLNKGEDGIGWQMMYLTRGGGYYFNVGCSDLIIQKRIKVIQLKDVTHFMEDGFQLNNGSHIKAELIITAKGYLGQNSMVEQFFGIEMAKKIGPVWGIDPISQELCNMWKPTPQVGLWFHAGSFAQCRINSKYLALQIKARELGMLC